MSTYYDRGAFCNQYALCKPWLGVAVQKGAGAEESLAKASLAKRINSCFVVAIACGELS